MSSSSYKKLDGGSSRSQFQPLLPSTPKDLFDNDDTTTKDLSHLSSMGAVGTSMIEPIPTSNSKSRNDGLSSSFHQYKSKSFTDLTSKSRPNSYFDHSINMNNTNYAEDIDVFAHSFNYKPNPMLDKIIDINLYQQSSNRSVFSAKSSLDIPFNVESPLLLKQVENFHNGPTRQTSRLDIFNRPNKLNLDGTEGRMGIIEDKKPKLNKRTRLHRRLKSMFTTGSSPITNDSGSRSNQGNKLAGSKYGATDNLDLEIQPKAKLNDIKPAQFTFQIPAYHFLKHQPNTENPAIFLSLIQVTLSDAMDLLDSDLNSATLQSHKFRICLTYGEKRWIIKRKLIDFLRLHTSLKLGYLMGRGAVKVPKFPNKIFYNLNNFNYLDRDHSRNYRYYEERRIALQTYLEKVLNRFNLIFYSELFEFLELSTNSFINNGFKGREGYLNLKIGNRFISECLPITFTRYKMVWCKVWDTCLTLTNQLNCTDPYEVLLFTPNFKVNADKKLTESHLIINFDLNSTMKFKVNTLHSLNDWYWPINKVMKDCPYTKLHRFQSYAPVHNDIKLVPLIDGDMYFKSVYQAILNAKSTIYIMDWWLSPELYLLRPPSKYPESRLDRLLKSKASEGVLIYILLYKEITLSLPNDSNHSKQKLKKLHPNIKVLRHPDHVTSNSVWFWAHHEKIVLVDNRVGYLGGLDLCFARYDTDQHRLVDTCPRNPIWPGIDYSNVRVKEYENVFNWEADFIDRTRVPRLPWHDINLKVLGKVVDDMQYHFVERWNFVKRSKARSKLDLPFLIPQTQFSNNHSEPDEGDGEGYQVQMLRSSSNWSSGIPTECSIYTTYLKLINNAKRFIYIENQFFVTSSANLVTSTVKNLIGEALVDRISRAHKLKQKFKVIVVMPLLPSFEHDLHHPDATTLRLVMYWQFMSINRGKFSVLGRLQDLGIDWKQYISFNGLRTYDKLEQNFEFESSPSQHLHDIVESNLNQPATTTIQTDAVRPNSSSELQNVVEYNANQPTTTTPITDTNTDSEMDHVISPASSLTNLTIASTVLSSKSILELDDNIKFVTEQVYVHSKLLIVDDTFMVLGSANLNDRSQLGTRDSEVAVFVAPNRWTGTFTDFEVTKVVRDIRLDLFKEHCGFIYHPSPSSNVEPTTGTESYILSDPTTDQFWDFWTSLAHSNTEIYREIFHCVPDDLVYSWDQYEKFFPNPILTPTGHVDSRFLQANSAENVKNRLNKIKGNLVEFPIDFLKEESKLGEVPTFAAEAIVPVEVFV